MLVYPSSLFPFQVRRQRGDGELPLETTCNMPPSTGSLTPLKPLMDSETGHDDPYVRVSVDIRLSTLAWLDGLRDDLGLHSRGAVLNRVLEEIAQGANP